MFGVMAPNTTGVAEPGTAVNVTVKTWSSPTSFTALGEIWMLASTNDLVAGPLPPGPLLPFVARVTVRPPIVTLAVTLAVNVFTTLLLTVSVQVATLPLTFGVAQVLLVVAPAGVTDGVIESNVTGVAPPGSAVTVIVKTCWL